MTLVALVAVASAGAAAVAALRPRWAIAWGVGLAALAAVAILAWRLEPGRVAVGTASFEIAAHDRSLLAAISAGGLLVGFVAAAASVSPVASAGLLAAIAACAVATVSADQTVGLWAIVGGGVAVLLAGALAPAPPPAPPVRRSATPSALRAVVGSGALGVAGIALAVPPLSSPMPDAGVVGLGYLAVGGSLAIRLASVPVHRWAARTADSAPIPLLVATIVWLPAVLALVAASWAAGPLSASRVDLGVERGVVVAGGLATIVLGAIAALAQDDLAHATVYLAIADLGIGLLAFAIPDAAVSGAVALCLVALAASKTALVGWLVAVETAFGSRRLPDLDGWIRRSPLLGLALALVVAATVGWPGSALLDARLEVGRSAAPAIAPLAGLATFAVLLAYARILAVGFRPASGAVESSVTSRPRRPAALAAADAGRLTERAAAAGRDLRAVWSLNRRPATALGVLLLGVLAIVVATDAL